MFADSTTNTAMCRCSLLVWFFSFLCADTTWWRSWDPYAPPFSPADEATTSRKQLDPLPSQLPHKKEKRKKKEKKYTQRRDSQTGTSVIHQHDQDFRTINHHGHHAKCPECCTGLMDPTENLNKIQQDILGLSAKLHQMTEDNSSWFGNLYSRLSRGNYSSNQERLLPVRTSRTLIACFVSVSACNYI